MTFARRVFASWMQVLLRIEMIVVLAAGHAAAVPVRAEPWAGATPPRYVLVLDGSGSMAEGERLFTMDSGVAAVLAILPDGAQVAVVAFNHEARILAPLTTLDDADRTALLARVDAIKAGGGTDLLAATRQALTLLGAGGGTVLLFSDGAQTGAGNVPWPEARWTPPARELVRQARRQQVVIETLGLGLRDQPEARALLQHLTSETGGEFVSIPEPRAVVDAFVALAARLGRYWRRSAPGCFSVSSPQAVIQVVSADAVASLFRIDDAGRRSPVDPTYQEVRAGLRVERALLASGSYAFEPSPKARRSDLLRPLDLAFTLPAATQVPAGRTVDVVLQARPLGAVQEHVAGNLQIEGAFRFGTEEKESRVIAFAADDPQGRVGLRLTTPAAPGPFHAVFTAESKGWTYRLDTWPGRLVTPPPLELTLTPKDQPGPDWEIQTSGSTTGAVVELQVDGQTEARFVQLQFRVADPRILVEPARVQIESLPQRIRLKLTRSMDPAEPPVLEFALHARAEVNNLVLPRLNAKEQATAWPVRWVHKRPGLQIRGIGGRFDNDPDPLPVRRGTSVSLPLVLAGTDLDPGSPTGVRLDASRVVGRGFTLRLRDRSGPVDVLSPDAKDAALELMAATTLLPGRHELAFTLQSSAPDVPLNGRSDPIPGRLLVHILPIDVVVKLMSRPVGPWSVLAPLEPVVQTVHLLVRATDEGPLPPGVRLEARAEGMRVEIVDQGSAPLERSSVIQECYRLTIPAQTPPGSGAVRFSVAPSPDLAASPAVGWQVAVQPVVLKVALDPALLTRPQYPGWQERVFGQFRRSVTVPLALDVQGPWAAAKAQWAVVDGRGRVSDWRSEVGHNSRREVQSDAGPYRVLLQAAYRHAKFVQGSVVPIPEEVAVVPVPTWVWAVLAGSVVVLGLAVVQPLPCKVCTEGKSISSGFGWIDLGGLVSVRTGRLWLRRTALGYSLRWKGGKGSDPGVRVFGVVRSVRHPLVAGQTIRLESGDRIVVEANETSRMIEVLGRNVPMSSPPMDRYEAWSRTPGGSEVGTLSNISWETNWVEET